MMTSQWLCLNLILIADIVILQTMPEIIPLYAMSFKKLCSNEPPLSTSLLNITVWDFGST
jgi:hypothetical protein